MPPPRLGTWVLTSEMVLCGDILALRSAATIWLAYKLLYSSAMVELFFFDDLQRHRGDHEWTGFSTFSPFAQLRHTYYYYYHRHVFIYTCVRTPGRCNYSLIILRVCSSSYDNYTTIEFQGENAPCKQIIVVFENSKQRINRLDAEY